MSSRHCFFYWLYWSLVRNKHEMRGMYPDILLVTLDCKQDEALRQRSWSSGGYWPALGLGWIRLLLTLVLISIASYLVGNWTSLSGILWSRAPVPESWLPKSIWLCRPCSKSAWLVLSAVSYQLYKNWITLVTSSSLVVRQYGLSMPLTYTSADCNWLSASNVAIDSSPPAVLT